LRGGEAVISLAGLKELKTDGAADAVVELMNAFFDAVLGTGDDLCSGRWGGSAEVGDEVCDGEVGFVAYGGDGGDL
jgi:hypothetical protein